MLQVKNTPSVPAAQEAKLGWNKRPKLSYLPHTFLDALS